MTDIISTPPKSYLGLSRTNISIIDVVRHNPGICNKDIIHSTGYVRSSVQEGLRELKSERNALQCEARQADSLAIRRISSCGSSRQSLSGEP